MDVVNALREHSEAGAAIVGLLYGDDGAEVCKALIEISKIEEKTKRRIGQTSNAVGLGAGLAATPGAVAAVRPAFRAARGKPPAAPNPHLKRIGQAVKGSKVGSRLIKIGGNKKFIAGAALGGAALQVGNVGGDALVSQLLKDKKPKPVVKSDFEIYTEISKVDDDKRQVFGWASVTKFDGQDVVDLQEDIIPLEEIEKAAYEFVVKSRIGGNMHAKGETGPVHVSDMIESMVITPEKKKAMGLPDNTPEGWWVGYKVNDDATWADAKSGKLAGFSVHGSGRRQPVGV